MSRSTNNALAERLEHIRESIDEWNNPITSSEDLAEAAARLRTAEGKVLVDHDVLFWAFRYCLSRSSYAVSDGVKAVVENWGSISPSMREMIHREIREHFETYAKSVHECDRAAWAVVLEMPL